MDTRLHVYFAKRRLLLLEYINTTTTGSSSTPAQASSSPPNVLLFVGGLYDNFRSPRYVDDLAALFPRDVPAQKWRVMHVQLSTAGRSWGLYDLNRDVEEISFAINYIRESIVQSQSTPIVLMGHSTGCQDLMHYLISPISDPTSHRPAISGAIFQAPVSDREAILRDVHRYPATKDAFTIAMHIVSSTPTEKHSTTLLPMDISLPLVGPSPVTITRFLSLASPASPEHPSMDDYFSSDLSDERLRQTFGQIGSATHLQPKLHHRSVMILQGNDDEAIPPSIDKALLISRWKTAVEVHPSGSKQAALLSPHSLIIPHALHDISGTTIDARTARMIVMRGAVLRYLSDVVGDIERHSENAPWTIFERDQKAIESERGKGVGKL